MEISVLNTYKDGAYFIVTFKYWEKGKCACTAEKIKRTFTQEPTRIELINSI